MLLWLLALPALAGPLDINHSSADQLAALPGLGPGQATAIVAHRSQHGAFPTISAVAQVPGVGLASVQLLRAHATARPAPQAQKHAPPAPLDLNTATEAELATLSGVSPRLAGAIVAERQKNGSYISCSDVTRVSGVGPATAALIAPRCRLAP